VKEDYERFKRNILQGLVSTDGRRGTTAARRDLPGKNYFPGVFARLAERKLDFWT
jgi:hypothetical protein